MKKIGFIAGSRIWQLGDWEPSLERTLFEKDDFLGDILKDEWDVYVSVGCTVAIVAALNGTVALTTVVGDNFFAQLAHALNFRASHACGIEARLNIDALPNANLEIGFCDALTEANGTAFTDYVGGAGGIPVPVAADAAIIGYDNPDSTGVFPNFTGVSVINGVAPMAINLGILPVGGTFYVLKVQLDAQGNARYYVNGALLGTHLLAVTPADPLTPWLTVRNKAAAPAVAVLTVDYVKFWQNR